MSTTPDPKSACLNLRSKQMYYKDHDADEEEHRREVERLFGPCDTTAWWCECTQTGRGPDGEPCNSGACAPSSRKCFVSVHSLT
jgi:hypothetical protein